jgi:hypothetical protein
VRKAALFFFFHIIMSMKKDAAMKRANLYSNHNSLVNLSGSLQVVFQITTRNAVLRTLLAHGCARMLLCDS